jgi:hypothetical protein
MIRMTIIISTSVNHEFLFFFPFLKMVFGVVFQYIYQNYFMYRVYILFFLAIGSSVFAVDSSQSILQAKKITDTSVIVSWEPIPDATKYKIFYDETALLEPANPRLMLDTDFITAQQGEITKISPTTEYTIMVHGYNDEGRDIGTTIPLHVETYSPVPQMNLSRDPLATSETTLEL